MEYLFSYGTLQYENVQIETFGRKLQGEKDILIGYQLTDIKITDPQVIAASGTDLHPILQFTGYESDLVKGTVFEIAEQELACADDYEVDDYRRVATQLKSGKMAWIYTAAEEV